MLVGSWLSMGSQITDEVRRSQCRLERVWHRIAARAPRRDQQLLNLCVVVVVVNAALSEALRIAAHEATGVF